MSIKKEMNFDVKRDFVTVRLNEKCFFNQNYTMELNFRGLINKELIGFYQSVYFDEDRNVV